MAGIYYPVSIAADTNGDMWVADYGSSAASLLASDGSAISPSIGYATSQAPFTEAVTLDAFCGWSGEICCLVA